MSKFILELKGDVQVVQKVGVTENGNAFVMNFYKDQLEELNSDYINEHYGSLQDEAYKRGINDGSLDVKQRVEEAYQKGLDEAWKAARRISVIELNGGLAGKELMKIYGTMDIHKIYDDNTVSEAIEKLKAYEQKQDDKIEVGDEVEWDNDFTGDRFIVTRIYQPYGKKEQCDGIDDDGDVYRAVLIESLVKTGRHFDIASILEAMKHD